jgi:hypothetical protein
MGGIKRKMFQIKEENLRQYKVFQPRKTHKHLSGGPVEKRIFFQAVGHEMIGPAPFSRAQDRHEECLFCFGLKIAAQARPFGRSAQQFWLGSGRAELPVRLNTARGKKPIFFF